MGFPAVLARMEGVVPGPFEKGQWLMAYEGLPGWCCEYPYGLCVAFAIADAPVDDEWLAQASLWLSSLRDNLDDGLLLDDGTLYLVRRCDSASESIVLQTCLEQQAAVARWLTAHSLAAQGGSRYSARRSA